MFDNINQNVRFPELEEEVMKFWKETKPLCTESA